MRNRLAYWGVAKLSVADVALGAEALVTTGAPEVNRAGCALIMLNVKATSLALNGLPSFHLTPVRTGIVTVFPPLERGLAGREHRDPRVGGPEVVPDVQRLVVQRDRVGQEAGGR